MNPEKTELATKVSLLETTIPSLPKNSQSFAASLVSNFKSRGLTPKQAFWVDKLLNDFNLNANAIDAVKNIPNDRSMISLGSVSKMFDMFQLAATKARLPAISLEVEGVAYKIRLASESARVPGSLNVIRGDGVWCGRILKSGFLENNARDPVSESLVSMLTRFAANPVEVAADHGHKTNNCCFCNRKLTTTESTSVGYGPECADRYGLPWGIMHPVK